MAWQISIAKESEILSVVRDRLVVGIIYRFA